MPNERPLGTVAELRAALRDYPDHYVVAVPGKGGMPTTIQLTSARMPLGHGIVVISRKDRT
jgi:hypothetical protein